MPVPPLLDRFGAWFLGRPGVRRGLCRQAFADPDADVGAPEEQIASLHLQCPGWAEALAAFARSGGFAGCGVPLPSQSLHVIWGDNDRILRAPQKQALQACWISLWRPSPPAAISPISISPARWLSGVRRC